MKKRFLSLLLSVVLIMGVLPVMSLTASAAATEYFADDFESYSVGDEWYGSDGDVMKIGDTQKWSMGKSLKSEIVSMEGYDGKTTNVMKITTVAYNATSGSAHRFFPLFSGEHNISGIYVYEMKVSYPSENSIMYWSTLPLRRDAGTYSLVSNKQPIGAGSGAWHSLRCIVDIATGEIIVYVNDELLSYKQYTCTNTGFPTYINFQDDRNVGRSIYIDDVNWYYHPDTTAAATKFPADSEENVSKAVNPAITFNNEILEATIGSDATLSNENVEITYTSSGETVEVGVASVALSEDGKTVTANPAEDLYYGTEYQVTFKNLKDVYGRDVASVSYSFTTMEQPQLSFSEVVFKKEALATEGEAISSLENGYISCEFSMTNNHATKTQNALLIAVLWENDAIKSFQFVKANLGYNETANFYGGFNVTDAENSKIETYIWDGITTMVPLCEKVEFTAAGVNN